MGVDEVIRAKRGDILQIAARHGVTEIRVFGSVARGDARPDSDVDFLVRVGPNHSRFFPGGLVMDLEELLGRKVDVVEAEGLRESLRDRVLSEAVPV
jgi:predicted nucleotidyltransferase